MVKDEDTCSRGNCTRARYQHYAMCLSCGVGQKQKWALHARAGGSVAKCRVPDCSGVPFNKSKYCKGCLEDAGPVLCQQYRDYISAKGRAKYAEQDFGPHDLAILPDYVWVKTAKCIGEPIHGSTAILPLLSSTGLAHPCLQCPIARATMRLLTMTTRCR
jgi:hypothetical protein